MTFFSFFEDHTNRDLKWVTLMVDEMLSGFSNIVPINIFVTFHSKMI